MLQQSYINKVLHNNDIGGSAGFPMSDYINTENLYRKQYGGSDLSNKVGLSRFEGLVIPLGLDSHMNNNTFLKSVESKTQPTLIDSHLFDRLFDNIAKLPDRHKPSQTRKSKTKTSATKKANRQ